MIRTRKDYHLVFAFIAICLFIFRVQVKYFSLLYITHSLTHSLTNSRTHSLTHSYPTRPSILLCACSFVRSFIYNFIHSFFLFLSLFLFHHSFFIKIICIVCAYIKECLSTSNFHQVFVGFCGLNVKWNCLRLLIYYRIPFTCGNSSFHEFFIEWS